MQMNGGRALIARHFPRYTHALTRLGAKACEMSRLPPGIAQDR